MNKESKIFIAGHRGLVGSAIHRNLKDKGYQNIITEARENLDLTNQQEVYAWFNDHKPEYVFLSAALVGGIYANDIYSADFIYSNLSIQTNVIDAAYRHGTKKLLFLGSSCVYPKFSKIPITEDQLLTGPLEPTNDAYAIAKIAGIKMCQSYRKQYGFNAISVMPTNLYGINDNFDINTGHVLPSMMAKFSSALDHSEHYKIKLWGDGSAMREFLYSDDLAEALYICMQKYDSEEIINIGTGNDISIKELASMIAEIVGYDREIIWDVTKPNGTPRKVLNVDKIKSLGWFPTVDLEEGIKKTYEWYKLCQILKN